MIHRKMLLAVSLLSTLPIVPAATLKTITQYDAEQIMGDAFVDAHTAAAYYGHTLTQEEHDQLMQIPMSKERLRQFRDTHILVPGFPMTIADISAKVPAAFTRRFWDTGRGGPHLNRDLGEAAAEKVRLRWYLIRKSVVSGSTSKTYNQAVRMVGPNEELPRACELVNAIVVYWLATGIKLYPDVYARSSSLISPYDGTYSIVSGVGIVEYRRSNVSLPKDGENITIGAFDERGLGGGPEPRKGDSTVVGIAPLWKFAGGS